MTFDPFFRFLSPMPPPVLSGEKLEGLELLEVPRVTGVSVAPSLFDGVGVGAGVGVGVLAGVGGVGVGAGVGAVILIAGAESVAAAAGVGAGVGAGVDCRISNNPDRPPIVDFF